MPRHVCPRRTGRLRACPPSPAHSRLPAAPGEGAGSSTGVRTHSAELEACVDSVPLSFKGLRKDQALVSGNVLLGFLRTVCLWEAAGHSSSAVSSGNTGVAGAIRGLSQPHPRTSQPWGALPCLAASLTVPTTSSSVPIRCHLDFPEHLGIPTVPKGSFNRGLKHPHT